MKKRTRKNILFIRKHSSTKPKINHSPKVSVCSNTNSKGQEGEGQGETKSGDSSPSSFKMTPNPKDDLMQKKSGLNKVNWRNWIILHNQEIRQQTAQEIFKEIENLKHKTKCPRNNYINMILRELKQKYLGDNKQ